MTNPTGETESGVLRLDFDRRIMVQFRGSVVTSDAGLLAYRELDDALGLTTSAEELLADTRTGKNGRHALVGKGCQPRPLGRLSDGRACDPAQVVRCDRRENRCSSIAAVGDGNVATPADNMRRKPMGEVRPYNREPEKRRNHPACLEKADHMGNPG